MKADPEIRERLERATEFVNVDLDRRLERVRGGIERRSRGRRLRALAVAAAIGVAAVGVVSQLRLIEDTRVPGAGVPSGRIAFLGIQGDQRGSLFDLDLATGDVEAVTRQGRVVLWAAPSPDGIRIAYALEVPGLRSEIIVARADGTGTATIFEAEDAGLPGPDLLDLSWSPDGERIAFSGRAPGHGRTIMVVNADGAGTAVVLDGTWVSVSWSPDGKRLLLTGFPGDEGSFDLYTVRPDGSDFLQLTNDEVNEHEPSWSPDGTRITFAMGGAYFQDVYVMDADGSDVRRLTDWEGLDVFPVWSHDGTWIAFASDRDATMAQLDANRSGDVLFSGLSLYAMRADGSGVTRLLERDLALPLSWTR